MKKQLCLLVSIFLSLISLSCHCRTLIGGNASAANTTFAAPVSVFKRDDFSGAFYSGAAQNGANQYAIARFLPGTSQVQFIGVAPQTVSLNSVNPSPSPLYNGIINFLVPMQGGHVATVANNLFTTLYVLDDLAGLQLLSLNTINDASNAATSGIVALAAQNADTILAAVKGSGQASFGTGNSGIAVLSLVTTEVTSEVNGVPQITKVRSIKQQDEQSPTGSGLTRAAPLSTASSAVFITDPVVEMGTVVDMYWSSILQSWYIAYDVTGAAGATDGARSVVVGRFNNGILTFTPIAPDAIFTAGAQDEIIGAIASSALVTAQKIRTMRTSTSLDYLLVLGGNGSISATANTLFALPVVNKILPKGSFADPANDPLVQATLANVTATPVTDFTPTNTNPVIQLFGNRRFDVPATTPSQIYTKTSVAAQVGQGALAAGPISTFFAVGDTVFASVGSPVAGQRSAIYYSQAILNNTGIIVQWTPWQPACGFLGSVFFSGYDFPTGTFVVGTGNSLATANTFYQMNWALGASPGLSDLVSVISSYFVPPTSLLAAYNYFGPGYQGILDCAVLAGVGGSQVVLAQTGITVSGSFTPLGSGYSANQATFTDGAITSSIPSTTQILALSGGNLPSCGPLQTIEIGATASNAWLFVGGIHGVAVLANPSGSGWNPAAALSTGFSGIVSGMAFIKIGSYSLVRKLMADSGFLYVLTDTQLDRIDLTASNFATGSLVITTLATGFNAVPITGINSLTPKLIDVIVSGKLAILATSSGLLSSGPVVDIRTASNASAVNWQPIQVPFIFLTPLQLYPISTTGRAQDVASGGGQLYVLNGYSGTDRAFLNRYFISDTSSSPVTSTTVTPMPDLFAQNVLAYAGNYGNYRNAIGIDGALFLSGVGRTPGNPPFGASGFFNNGIVLPLTIQTSNDISAIVRNGASGSWIFAGDFGLRVNE